MRWFALAVLGGLLGACTDGAGSEAEGTGTFTDANVLLISVDTLRADRLGAYGYERDTTPNIDALAADGIVFEQMYSNSPKTASSHMSLFTSLLPSAHKVRNQSARLGLESPILSKNRFTLTQVLNKSGYYNAAVAGGGNLNPEMGFKRGFMGRFDSQLEGIDRLVKKAKLRIGEVQESGAPGFVFLHTYEVHGPYLPPREYMDRFAPKPVGKLGARVLTYVDLPFNKQWSIMNKGDNPYWGGKEDFGPSEAAYLSDLYDAEIAHMDHELGRLFDWMRQSGAWDDWIVIIVSDHGEEFLEHGDFEHDQLYREHLHVPFVMRLPGDRLAGQRVSGLTSLLDVAPTVLDLLGLGAETPDTFQGSSLVPAIESGRTENRPFVAERVMFPDDYKATLRHEAGTVTFHARDGKLTAFDLTRDPAELDDVFESATFAPEDADRLRGALSATFQYRDQLDLVDAGGTLTVATQEELDQLKALGYVGGEEIGEVPEGTPLDSWPEDG